MYGTDGKFLNQNGDYEVTKSGGSGASGRFDVDSWFLKGLTNFETGPLSHNFAVATNGYRWTIYSARNNGGRANLGNSNLYNPRVFNDPHVKKGSGTYKSSSSDMKTYLSLMILNLMTTLALSYQFQEAGLQAIS